MSRYKLPIWIHPTHGVTSDDYRSEKGSKYATAGTFGWPYDTTMAMTRVVFSGVLVEKVHCPFHDSLFLMKHLAKVSEKGGSRVTRKSD